METQLYEIESRITKIGVQGMTKETVTYIIVDQYGNTMQSGITDYSAAVEMRRAYNDPKSSKWIAENVAWRKRQRDKRPARVVKGPKTNNTRPYVALIADGARSKRAR